LGTRTEQGGRFLLLVSVLSLAACLALSSLAGCSGGTAQVSVGSPNPSFNLILTGIAPSSGGAAGGVLAVINGINFQSGTIVSFGGTVAGGMALLNSSQIQVVAPAHAAGTVDVQLRGPDGQVATLRGGYTFSPDPPPAPPNIFQDGFEERNGSAFAYDSSNVVLVNYVNDPAVCHTGNWCGQMTLQPAQSQMNIMWVKHLTAQPLQGFYRGWWKFPTDWRWNTSDVDQKAIILDNFPTRIYVNFRAISPTESRIAVFNNLGPDQFFTYDQSGTEPTIKADGQWHSLEVYCDQLTGTVVVWFDGKLHVTVTALNIGTTPFTEARFGAYMNGASGNASGGPRSFYMDDIAIGTARLGP
jgi:hypothetical protein